MSQVDLPVPRLEALLFCFRADRDARGAWTLTGIGDAIVAESPPPCTISGFVFVRYVAGAADHGTLLRVVNLSSGEIIGTYAGRTTAPGPDLPVTSAVTVAIPFRSLGRHAIQLWVDGSILGTALLDVRASGG